MEHLKRYFIFNFSLLLLLGNLVIPAFGQGEKKGDLVGHWTFEKGAELEDLTGHFSEIDLLGAEVKDGKLHIGSNKWAMTTGYKGPDIGPDKTLVTWLYLDDLNVTKGATLAVNKSSADTFDAIVYAERQPKRWMAGSSFFMRTQDPLPGFEEKETGKLIQLAISYEDEGGNAQIAIYRNGDRIGGYTMGPIVSWEEDDVEALFGPRALIGGTAYGWVIARVEDARIYNAALSKKEISNLVENTLDVEAQGKTRNYVGKTESFQAVIRKMIIHFKKGKHQWKHKPDTLTCVRDDGSVTSWTHLHSGFVHHDFAHYVIETTLGFENAFFGLVAKGWDIPDFSEPKSTRPFKIPEEAINTEPIVALLQADLLEDETEQDGIFQNYSASLPVNVTDEQLEVMRQKLHKLLQQWQDLQPGASMTLQFYSEAHK